TWARRWMLWWRTGWTCPTSSSSPSTPTCRAACSSASSSRHPTTAAKSYCTKPRVSLRAWTCFSPPILSRPFCSSTNICEDTITVDGIVYVVDCGFVKQKQFQPASGMDALTVVPISKVAAKQRAGRAGRTRPGHAYRLYTLETYDRDLLDD